MGEAPTKASTPTGAVFLSYASQDAQAARTICEALRAGGIEVWFDQSELRGGDAWDQSIRRQIKTCALFIPVISRHTHERAEGYFRLEWKLAVDRSHLIMANKAFLLPVVIDDTGDDDENVPEKFREVQWTCLPGGDTPPAFVERIIRLLSPDSALAPNPSAYGTGAMANSVRHTGGLLGRRTPQLYGAVGVAALLALGYLTLELYNRSRPTAPGIASIAVLPLTNESEEASQQYFSDGISEDLITALSQVHGLKVIGRTSAFQFRDSKEDSRSIGAKLGVTHLLEGSVRRSGDTVRVSAALIDTLDGSTQWSERYDRPYKDLFGLQDEITRAVAEALRARLLSHELGTQPGERPPGGSLEAYGALLQGRFYASRNNEADLRKAVEYYNRATQLDPRYALAWNRLSDAWAALGYAFLGGAPAQEAYAKAREAADRALALAPELASAHVARGYLLQLADFNWRGAEAEFRRALELSPNDGEAQLALGYQLAVYGELEPAVELTRQALATEPLRANWYNWLAIYLSAQNRLSEAEQAIHKAIELQPSGQQYYSTLTIIEVQRRNAQAALAAAQREPPGYSQDFAVALARQIGGDAGTADAALRTLMEKDAMLAGYYVAEVYALRGDANGTFQWLDRAWSNRDSSIPNLLFDPFILRYKDDPRFTAFCRKVGLPLPGEVREQT